MIIKQNARRMPNNNNTIMHDGTYNKQQQDAHTPTKQEQNEEDGGQTTVPGVMP